MAEDLVGTEDVRRASLDGWRAHLGRDVDPRSVIVELTGGSLSEAFHVTAATAPQRPALAIDGEEVTHGELDVLAARFAGWLRAHGVEHGARVLLCGRSSSRFVVAYLGILWAGAVVVPAEYGFTHKEIRALVDDADPVAAVAAGPAIGSLRAIKRHAPALRMVVSLDADEEPSLAEAAAAGPAAALPSLVGDDTAILAYTSGTTGRPKGVPLTHANLLSSIRAAMLAWRWTEDDTLVQSLPLSHQHGLGGVHATLLAGSRAVIHSRFDPRRLAESVRKHHATVLFAVPAIYERLSSWEGVGSAGLSSLRLAVSGSASLSPELFDRVAGFLGEPPLERYGTTESGLDVSNLYERRRPGNVGLPLPGVEAAVVDPHGRPQPAGTEGEIVVRGPQVFSGYWRRRDETEASFLPGGWFRTGDIGRVAPGDGYLSVIGRLKELIITGGLNVHPRDVEVALESHPDVAKAAVIGVASERWGEEVTAFVVAAAGAVPDPDDLIRHARERLAAYKCPKRIFLVEALPIDDMGKLSRAALRSLAEEDAGTDASV